MKNPERYPIRNMRFSLIELLVVIAIISILASLLLPALKQARDRTKQIQCSANLRQIGIATRQYIDDNNAFLPDLNNRMNFFLGDKLRDYLNFQLPLGTGNAAVFCCPAQSPHVNNGGYIIDYGHCAGAFGITATYFPVKRDSFIASDTFVLIDAIIEGGGYLNKTYRSTISFRHLKYANILYYDGHVGSKKSVEEDDPGWTKEKD